MKKNIGIFIVGMMIAVIMCGTAFASISGCTVTSHTNIKDPGNTEFNAMMANCSEITLEDTLRIDHSDGLIIPGDKTFVFSRTSGKHGKIEANSILLTGTVTIKLAPMENNVLTGAWASKDSLRDSPYDLIKITNTSGYLEKTQFDLFEQYEEEATWKNFWASGYKIDKNMDGDRIKSITLTYEAPPPTPTSGDEDEADDGGGGCNVGLVVLIIMGMGLMVNRLCLSNFK